MSWQAYVDSNLVGTGKITKAAILGIKGGVWASSAGYQIAPAEQQTLTAGFTDPATLQASGIHLSGSKFFTLQANERSVYGKKNDTGVICVKTNQAILVGEYGSGTAPGEATKIVEALADYLIGSGY